MGPYLESLRKLKGTGLSLIHPGHGDDIKDPDTVIDWYIAHRLQRHREILESIEKGSRTVDEIVETVYAEIDNSLYPLAKRSVRAHLALLTTEGRIALNGDVVLLEPPPTQ
jgi:glyoxylase-like metal-dependent hydrolase (beta-lactamase superfamily II)